MIVLILPFYFYSAKMMRRLKFQLRNQFMPGLFYAFATGIYNVWYWYDQYVLFYDFHEEDDDFYNRSKGIWDEIAKLAFVMFLHQIATVLIAFNIKWAKYLKYFNIIFFLIYLLRCFGQIFYTISGKTKNKIIQTLLHDSGIFYRLFYNFLYLYSLVLLNICFVLSNIKDFIPKKFHIPIYLSIFFFVLGLLVTTGADTFYESNIIWRYWFNKRSKLNYIKLAIQIVLNFCLEIPTLIIL